MHAVDSFQRGAARSRMTLVAVAVRDVAEIRTSRALQNISAKRRHVPKLLAGREPQRVGDYRIVALNIAIGCDIRHSRQRAKPWVAVLEIDGRPRTGKRIDVD